MMAFIKLKRIPSENKLVIEKIDET